MSKLQGGFSQILEVLVEYSGEVMMDKVLDGVRVVEFVGIGPCPFAGMMLGDMGAEVVRIDRLRSGQISKQSWDSTPSDPFLRGKGTLEIDLKHPKAEGIVANLIQKSHVLIEGFRPLVMERLGFGPKWALGINPALVYGRMTGWGQSGPLSLRAGHDINYISISGVLSTIGEKDGAPVVPVNYVGDFGGGAMMLLAGVLGALFSAQRDGRGRVVDASMVEGSSLLATMVRSFMARDHWSDERGSNLLDGGAPFYRTYRCKDGGYVSVGALESQFFQVLVDTLDLKDQEALTDQYNTSTWNEMAKIFEEKFLMKSRDEWAEIFFDKDACVTPVLTLREAPTHPHNVQRHSFIAPGGVVQPAASPKFVDPVGIDPQMPTQQIELGTKEILKELGYGEEEILEFFDSQVVS